MKDFDILMDIKAAKHIVDNEGWESLLKYFRKLFPKYNLYQLSTHWYEDSRYICKAKGAKGDIIIGWKDIHA